MALNIQTKLSPYNHYNYNTITYIVLHDVGAVSTAKNNADYFYGGDRGASAHYFVDSSSIWQVVADGHGGWHVGDGGGRYGISNTNSIGIEMCLESNRKTSAATQAKTIELVKFLQKKYGIPNSRVVRHYDASRKRCPGSMADNNWAEWNAFKARIDGATAGSTGSTSTGGGNGQVVTVAAHATHWATGQAIPAWVRGQKYKVIETKDIKKSNSTKQYLLEGINSWILSQDIVGGVTVNKPAPAKGIGVGSKVAVAGHASGWATGQSIPTWVRGKVYTVKEVQKTNKSKSNEQYLLDGINSWILSQDVVGGYGSTAVGEPAVQAEPKPAGWTNVRGTFRAGTTINIRNAPSTNSTVMGQYVNGETVVYTGKLISGGYEWIRYISGRAGNPTFYMAVGEVGSGAKYGTFI